MRRGLCDDCGSVLFANGCCPSCGYTPEFYKPRPLLPEGAFIGVREPPDVVEARERAMKAISDAEALSRMGVPLSSFTAALYSRTGRRTL